MNSVAALRKSARAVLLGEDGAREADWLIAHALGRSQAWLIAHAEFEPTADALTAIDQLIIARARGVPVAQLTGWRGFWTLDLAVDSHTLIPRPETELLVELALARLPDGADGRLADLGTGSGAVALALAQERPRARIVATDASRDALRVAEANAARLGLQRVEFRCGDWCSALDAADRLDMIVSNPPYLADADPHLEQGDLRFEPRTALASGADGLDAIRQIVATAPGYLRTGGWLLLEHGVSQGDAVRATLEAAGFVDVETVQDLEARDRVSLGRVR